jgi:hypothetical protein
MPEDLPISGEDIPMHEALELHGLSMNQLRHLLLDPQKGQAMAEYMKLLLNKSHVQEQVTSQVTNQVDISEEARSFVESLELSAIEQMRNEISKKTGVLVGLGKGVIEAQRRGMIQVDNLGVVVENKEYLRINELSQKEVFALIEKNPQAFGSFASGHNLPEGTQHVYLTSDEHILHFIKDRDGIVWFESEKSQE